LGVQQVFGVVQPVVKVVGLVVVQLVVQQVVKVEQQVVRVVELVVVQEVQL